MVRKRMQSKITKVQLNDATFSNVTFEPSILNFFFGKNGTGKSTISRNIRNRTSLTWKTTLDSTNTEIQVFNEDYISENIQTLDDMNGVFFISEVDIKIEKEIKDKTIKLDEHTKERNQKTQRLTEIEVELSEAQKIAQKDIPSKVKELNITFPKHSLKKTNPAAFTQIVDVQPIEHSLDELKTMYNLAFDPNAHEYAQFTKPAPIVASSSLVEPIIAAETTQFSTFVKKLGNLSWLSYGHEHYEENEEKVCPYCQRPLTAEIISDIKSCFDSTYNEEINKLKSDASTIEIYEKTIEAILSKNLELNFPSLSIERYKSLSSQYLLYVKELDSAYAKKINNPSDSITISEENNVIDDLCKCIDDINEEIKKNNIAFRDTTKVTKFNNALLEYMAFNFKAEIATYKSRKSTLDAEKSKLDARIRDILNPTIATLSSELDELSTHVTSTLPVVNEINALLDNSGYQGFHISQNAAKKNSYQIIRQNGEVAHHLSEGERNFICFLYFYFSTFGNIDGSSRLTDRVIVIDDPVSSLDSDAVFIISSLIRDLIETCQNYINPDAKEGVKKHITQMFILTHNAFFYNEIAPMYLQFNEYANFYTIRKQNNSSSIVLNTKLLNKGEVTEKEINIIPNQGNYASLWEELNEAKSPNVVLNVMRRILEIYFLHNLGIHTGDLYKEILDKHKEDFITEIDGVKSNIDYKLARAMLSYIDTSSGSSVNTIYFSSESDDIDKYKIVFEKIFKAMHQDQHYNMMMNR